MMDSSAETSVLIPILLSSFRLKERDRLALSGLSLPSSFVVPLDCHPRFIIISGPHMTALSNHEFLRTIVFLSLSLVRCDFVSASRFVNASTVLDSVVEGAVSG